MKIIQQAFQTLIELRGEERRREKIKIIGELYKRFAVKVLYNEGIDFIIVKAKDTIGGRFQDTQFVGYTVEDRAN